MKHEAAFGRKKSSKRYCLGPLGLIASPQAKKRRFD